MKTIALIFASILMISIFSFGVFSAGSSTGGSTSTNAGLTGSVSTGQVDGCPYLTREISSRVAEIRADGKIVITQELEKVYRNNHVLIPEYLLRVVTIANSTSGFNDDEVELRNAITGESYNVVITSEGHGTVTIGGQTYTIVYVGSTTIPTEERYITIDFPQTTSGQIMVFNCAFRILENETESEDDEDNETASEYISPTREGYIGVCETKDDRKERVKCRLEASKRKEKIEESIPEACRKLGATKKEDCRDFYKRIQICYDKVGKDKDRCFKEKSGLLKAALVSNAENKEGIRTYISTLLYDLQERVEKKVEAGEVTVEEGAELIAMITEIKEDITNQVPGKEVKNKMNELKNKWREVMQ